jgi:hypothetical protein
VNKIFCIYIISIIMLPIKIIGQHILLPVVIPNTINCPTDYTLVFDDEFNDSILNMTKWEYGLNWTMATQDNYFGNPAMVQFTGSSVILANQCNPIYYNNTWYDWQSGVISTPSTFIGAGGKIEIRCKFPSVLGTHPAFWLFGACRKEIDVFEVFGYNQEYQTNFHATAPSEPCMGPGFSWEENLGDVNPGQWYICSIEWNDIYVVWKINGNIIRKAYKYYYDLEATYPVTDCPPANATVYEDLLLPVNGDDFRLVLGNAVDDLNSSLTTLEIDYCRGYALIGNGENIIISPNPSNGTFTIKMMNNLNGSNQHIGNCSENNIVIYDIAGRIVFQTNTSQEQITVNLGTLSSGIYVVMVKNNTQTNVSKVIIQNTY